MNRFLAVAVALLFACGLTARAAGPDDQYIGIYYLIQQGDVAQADGRYAEAAARYTDAQDSLLKLQRANPLWQTNVVSFRLSYLAKQLAAPELKTALAQPTPVSPAPQPTTPAVDPETAGQVNALASQVQQLQANNSSLEAKLREALSARPASVDPAAVTQAEERIRQLAKENDLLKVSLATAPNRPGGGSESKQLAQLRKDLDEAKRKLASESARASALAREKGDLQDRLDKTNTSPSDLNSRRAVQKQLDDTKRKLDEQRAIADQLLRDKNGLTVRLSSLEAEAASASALRAENALLRKQVANFQSGTVPAASTNDLARRLASAEMQIAALQSERDLLRLERTALESRVKTLIASASAKPAAQPAARAEDAKHIRELEQELEVARTKLSLALNELARNKSAGSGAKADELAGQLAALRAKLNVYEAKPVPYSAEELALFRQAPSRLASTDQPMRKSSSIPKPPPGTGTLVVEAQRAFARGEFVQAEQKYQQVLSKDSKNVYTLANLAAIQIEADKLDDAEKNLKQALAVAPDDAYSLQMLGYLKFRQEKYDDALTYLSQAAQFSPDSAEIHNYLGVTLSHKGQRNAAESALRKALVLEPGYGSAHNNLAVIYATQIPPLVELARWHYQKARDAGHPKNAELEKLFDKKAASAQP